MPRVTALLMTVCAVMGAFAAPASAARPWWGHASYSVPLDQLDAALDCHGGIDALTGAGTSEPVLLVHGTGVTRENNWQGNYWQALPAAGFDTCWVQLPKAALGDIQ